MGVEFIYPEFEVVRSENRCIACCVCERQCANEVHSFDAERKLMLSDETKCVNCQRCVSLCPTRALKIVKSDCRLRENANWQNDTIKEIYKQANSGGVLLSSMGNPKEFPVYWDKILINASQVTSPSIDPLREPMETMVFLGKKPEKITRDGNGALNCELAPQLELSMPVMFSAMSYGSISYNAHASLARAATELGIYYNTGEGGLHEDFYRWLPGDLVFIRTIWKQGQPWRSKWVRAPSPALADICPVRRSWVIFPEPVWCPKAPTLFPPHPITIFIPSKIFVSLCFL